MGSDLYFYEQCDTRKIPRRYRKLPEELPESLRFAHLNPKVAALLASKERGQRLDNEDPFGDGMGKKSLLPDINAAFTNVRNQFDSAMSNDEDSQRYLFEEAKISAAQVLQQLSRVIYFYEDLYQHVPRSLEYHLMSSYDDFTRDIVVVPRDWQTHTMKEQYANKLQQQEAISEEEISDNERTGRSGSRLQSERSSEVGSKMNIRRSRPRLGLLEVSEGVEPGSESRLGRRSESRVSLAPSQLKGHLDVGSISRVGSRRKGSSLSSHRSISNQSRRLRDDISLIAETPSEARSTAMANPLSYMQTINFQLSNKSFEEKGWILLKGRQEEVDQNTVLEYCITRLQESMKDIANQRQKNLDQGHDKPVMVRYYGDSRKETLLKYRKSPSKPASSLTIQKGGKPRIPNIIDECSEGKLLMQASHIDGSTVIYYPSGRPAVIFSAAGFGRPGYYTIVYEDELDSKMLACFTPSGRGVCYYDNGVVRFLATEKGGHLTEVNGKLIRKWKWPHSNVKITEPIYFQINNHLMFRCVGQNQMTIVFSCQKESARFSVGPAPEADEYRPMEDTDQLLTAFTFSSKAAKDLMRIFAPKKQKKRSRKKKKKKKKQQELEKKELEKKESGNSKELEKKESENSKQVKFSSVTATVPKLISGFRRMSLAAQQAKPVETRVRSKSWKMVSPLLSQSGNIRDLSGTTNSKDKLNMKRNSLTPDPQSRVNAQKKYSEDLKKRAKSARQTKRHHNGVGAGVRGKRPSARNVSSSKFTTSDKQTEIESKTSEEGFRNTDITKQSSRSHQKSVQDQLSTTTPSSHKVPSSILKKGPAKSMDTVMESEGEEKDTRICKSAKLKTKLFSTEDVEKRAKSATTHADHDGAGTQKHSRHKYSTSTIQAETSGETLKYSAYEIEEPEKEQDSDNEIGKQSGMNIPKKAIINDDEDDENDDEYEDSRNINIPVPLLMVTSSTNEVDRESDAEFKETDKEEESEEDDFPPNFTYRRPRGGCAVLIQETDSEENSDKTNENEEAAAKDKSDTGIDTDKTAEQSKEDVLQQEKKEVQPPKSGKRRSSVMKSIMLFRQKVMAKKGIEVVISETSSSGTSDTDTDSDQSQTSKSQSTEIIKLLQDFPDRVAYDLEVEKELARLQRKAKNLVDDWMEHYRIALGFQSPLLQNVEDTPRHSLGKRNIKSAKGSSHLRMIRMAVLGLDFEEEDDQSPAKKNRIPSAPLKGEIDDEIDEELQQLIADKQQTVKFDESGQAVGDGALSPSALNTLNRLTETASRRSARSKASSARSSGSPSRAQPAPPTERAPSVTSGTRSFCPLVIRQQKLNYDRPQCRCSRHHIPFIMDIEIDEFIKTETQESQMIVIMIVSSLKNIKNKVTNVDFDFYINKEGVPFHRVFPGITKAEEMLNEIYVNQNRNRTRPCVQSRMDMFRVFKYDINSAAEMSNHTQPLLMTRHNVVPGMFLIYCDGKLVFCDHIFNGYGNARKDFKKQIMKCRHDSIQGCYLPKDFRFSPGIGKSGLRSAWGGEIGGAGVDKYSSSGTVIDQTLHPIHRPTSTPSSSENSQPIAHDAVKLDQAKFIIASLSATGFQTVNLVPRPPPSPTPPHTQTV